RRTQPARFWQAGAILFAVRHSKGTKSVAGRSTAAKRVLYPIVEQLHDLRLSDSMIGKIVGISSMHVRRILSDCGRTRRWCDVEDVRASLPDDLRQACAALRPQ